MRAAELQELIRRTGYSGALKLLTARRRLGWLLPREGTLGIKGLAFPFHFRRVSSDKYVIAEVLLGDQYDCLTHQPDVRTIVDAGANIGSTAVFLLNQHPLARVVAVEPDPDNFAILEKNLRPYAPRAVAVHGAIWPREETVWIDRGSFRDGADWSTQVTGQAIQGAAAVPGLPLPSLFSRFGLDRVDILKIDIEGAERFILDESFAALLDRVGTVAIELHDATCRDLFKNITDARPGTTTQHGELTVWDSGRSAAQFVRSPRG